jgi:hypothetical protein
LPRKRNENRKAAIAKLRLPLFFLFLFFRFISWLLLSFIRRLAVVCRPLAFGQLHVGKRRFEGRILGAAGIDTKTARPFPSATRARCHF